MKNIKDETWQNKIRRYELDSAGSEYDPTMSYYNENYLLIARNMKNLLIHESLVASHEGLCLVQSVGQGIITIFLHAH